MYKQIQIHGTWLRETVHGTKERLAVEVNPLFLVEGGQKEVGLGGSFVKL